MALLIVVGVLVLAYAALEWPLVWLLLRGLATFLAGCVGVAVLLAALGAYWLLDVGLKRLVEFLGDNAGAFE